MNIEHSAYGLHNLFEKLSRKIDEYGDAIHKLPERRPIGFEVSWSYEYEGTKFADRFTAKAERNWKEYRNLVLSDLRGELMEIAREIGIEGDMAEWLDKH